MYIPPAFREEDRDKLLAFMRDYPFITLVSVVEGVPFASHIPVVTETRGDEIVITGHLAKANPQWQTFGHGEALAIFTGPHAYISPTLYEKRENVPTWNYIAVHAYGVPTAISLAEDPERLYGLLGALITQHEATYTEQWEDLTPKYRESKMRGIIGFEMRVSRLEGKYKLSQNRSLTEQQQVADALSHDAEPSIAAVGIAMQTSLDDHP